MWTWNDLKAHWKAGEQWVEGEETHLAVLWARAMDAERKLVNKVEGRDPVAQAAAAPAEPAVTTNTGNTTNG